MNIQNTENKLNDIFTDQYEKFELQKIFNS